MSGYLALLGPQRPKPQVGHVLTDFGIHGPIATITAGWRHDEDDLAAMKRITRREVVLLPLYDAFEQMQVRHPGMAEAYRARQERVLAYKEAYRIRLHAHLAAIRELQELTAHDNDLFGPELNDAVASVQALDRGVPERIAEFGKAAEDDLMPWADAIREWRDHFARLLSDCGALLLAGGHIGVLRNRMRFFGVDDLIRDYLSHGGTLLAWGAGAMVLCPMIVLYYDDPPDGRGDPEVLDAGVGLIDNVICFPNAAQRLRLQDPDRMKRLVMRFAPARCLGLEVGTQLVHREGLWTDAAALDAATLGARE